MKKPATELEMVIAARVITMAHTTKRETPLTRIGLGF